MQLTARQRRHFILIAQSFSPPPLIQCLILYLPPLTLEQRLLARPSHPTLTDPGIAMRVLRDMMRQWDPPRRADPAESRDGGGGRSDIRWNERDGGGGGDVTGRGRGQWRGGPVPRGGLGGGSQWGDRREGEGFDSILQLDAFGLPAEGEVWTSARIKGVLAQLAGSGGDKDARAPGDRTSMQAVELGLLGPTAISGQWPGAGGIGVNGGGRGASRGWRARGGGNSGWLQGGRAPDVKGDHHRDASQPFVAVDISQPGAYRQPDHPA